MVRNCIQMLQIRHFKKKINTIQSRIVDFFLNLKDQKESKHKVQRLRSVLYSPLPRKSVFCDNFDFKLSAVKMFFFLDNTEQVWYRRVQLFNKKWINVKNVNQSNNLKRKTKTRTIEHRKQNVYWVKNKAGEYNKIKYICKIVYKL